MQMLYPFSGSIQQYIEGVESSQACRPAKCPQCESKQFLVSHGFYSRTVVDLDCDCVIRVRRYLCSACRRTVSLLPEFVLPYLRFTIRLIGLFLKARLAAGQRLKAAADAAFPGRDAISAGTAVDCAVQTAGRNDMRRAGCSGDTDGRQRLRHQSDRHAGANRLDRRASISVRATALSSVGLARVSRSERDTGHNPAGGLGGRRVPTEHLHGFKISSVLVFVAEGGFARWTRNQKKSRYSATL